MKFHRLFGDRILARNAQNTLFNKSIFFLKEDRKINRIPLHELFIEDKIPED